MEKYRVSYESDATGRHVDGDESLRRSQEKLTKRAKVLRIEVSGILQTGSNTYEANADVPTFGASLGKLPLAHMAIEHLRPDTRVHIDESQLVPNDGGRYNIHAAGDDLTVAELLDDMLRHSRNSPFRMLSRELGGAAEINEYYRQHGWIHTSVNQTPNGRFTRMGYTTPREALDQMERVLDLSTLNVLGKVAVDALRNSAVTRYGIRRTVTPSTELIIHNKTGEYNGDEEDHYAVRHDVGTVEGPDGMVCYAIMTSSPMSQRGKLADWLVGRFGAEIARAAGGTDIKRLGSLARRAS